MFVKFLLTCFFIPFLKVFSNEDLEDTVRHLALEVIITLCEVGSAMMKKESQSYIEPLVLAILKMMADIEDDENWSFSDEIVDEDNDKSALTIMCPLNCSRLYNQFLSHFAVITL